jgi:predicted Kef-type K+ transport protein
MNERRGLTFGIVLVAIGGWFLLRRSLDLSGPGPILLLVGVILFAVSAANRFEGPLLAGCVLLGLGAGFLLEHRLSPWLSRGGVILLGLGCGFLMVVAVDAAVKRRRGPGALVAGLILTGLALSSALFRWLDLSAFRENFDRAWPWLLVAAGIVLVATSLKKRRA